VVLVHSPPTTAADNPENHDDNDETTHPTPNPTSHPTQASTPPAPALLRGLLPLCTILRRGGGSDGEAAAPQPEPQQQQAQADVGALAWGAVPQLLAVAAGDAVAVIHLPLVATVTTDATGSCQQQADASPTAVSPCSSRTGDGGPAWSARGCFRLDAAVTGRLHGRMRRTCDCFDGG
jgi:hypothetical protein